MEERTWKGGVMMLDAVRRAYLFGLGVLTVTKEKIEEVVDEMVKKGEVAVEDKARVVDEFVEKPISPNDLLKKVEKLLSR